MTIKKWKCIKFLKYNFLESNYLDFALTLILFLLMIMVGWLNLNYGGLVLFAFSSFYLIFIAKFRRNDFFNKPLKTSVGISIVVFIFTLIFQINIFFNSKIEELTLVLIAAALTGLIFFKISKTHNKVSQLNTNKPDLENCSNFKIRKNLDFQSLVTLVYLKKCSISCGVCGKTHDVRLPAFYLLFFLPSLVFGYFILNSEMDLVDFKLYLYTFVVLILPVILTYFYLTTHSED